MPTTPPPTYHCQKCGRPTPEYKAAAVREFINANTGA
jgi:hypothetical protein